MELSQNRIQMNKSLVVIVLTVLAFSLAYAQDLPPKHRGMHPVLKVDGKVIDKEGKTLGSIKNSKVCDVTGKVIGVISAHGDVTTASGKTIGKIHKGGTFESMKGHVVTTDPDGVVRVAGKEVAKVQAGYKDETHGCVLHCFFSSENEEAKEVDSMIGQE